MARTLLPKVQATTSKNSPGSVWEKQTLVPVTDLLGQNPHLNKNPQEFCARYPGSEHG